MPPVVLPQTARQIRLEHVDRGVKAWFKKVVQPRVSSPQGGLQDVHVTFSSGERWVIAADRKGMRDSDGRLILPIIELTRSGFDMTENMSALGTGQPTMQVAKLISPKMAGIANNDLTRPISQRRLRDGAVYEIHTVPFPIAGTMPYKVRIQTQYTQQMNEIIEKLLFNLEFFDVPSFLIELDGSNRSVGIPSGVGSTEKEAPDHIKYSDRPRLDNYYVVGYIDGNLADEGNLKEFTDQERIIELQFAFKVPVALMLSPEGEKPSNDRQTTAFTVQLGLEESHQVDSFEELDIIFGPDGVK